MSVPAEVLSAIKSRVDIVQLVGEHAKLKKAGADYSACCPFHEEKTPSFTVSPTKHFYHCFGCGAHGDQIDWMVEYLGMPWNEAVARLAEVAGVQLPENEDSARIKAKSKVSKILAKAATWMHQGLLVNEPAFRYVSDERKLPREIIELFLVGWAPKSLHDYTREFSQDEVEVLIESGLLGKTDGRLYPKLGGRIIFPLRDAAGWVIGFSGRAMGDAQPKYMNSPESPFFSKRNEIFRPPDVQRTARRAGRVLVTEGYFDVISLHEAGFPYAVAGMGTATTPGNLESMFALADELVFCFDGDKAGRQAAWKALQAALPFIGSGNDHRGNRLVSFVFLPDGHDPDEFIRSRGKDEFAVLLAEAMPLSRFFVESYRKKREAEPMEKHSDIMAQAAGQISMVKDGMLQNGLATSLASVFDVSVDQIRRAGGFATRRVGGPARITRALTVPSDALEIGFLVNLLRRPWEIDCLATDVELKILGGDEIVSLLRQANLQDGDDGDVTQARAAVLGLFMGTPYLPLVERLLETEEADDSLPVNAKRIELAWVTRQLDDAMKLGDRDALRQLLARKHDVQSQIERAYGSVAA